MAAGAMGDYKCVVLLLTDTASFEDECLCFKLVSLQWYWSVQDRVGVGDDGGVAVKSVVIEVQQAPIGCVAERRGWKQSWRYRIHRRCNQMKKTRRVEFREQNVGEMNERCFFCFFLSSKIDEVVRRRPGFKQ